MRRLVIVLGAALALVAVTLEAKAQVTVCVGGWCGGGGGWGGWDRSYPYGYYRPYTVILMARPMAATTATAMAMLDLTGAATAGVVVGVVGDAIDGILRDVALVTFQAGDPEPSAAISNSSPEK
jgi:hypothetical protein